MRCPHCSRESDGSAINFCPFCGSGLPKDDPLSPPPLPEIKPPSPSPEEVRPKVQEYIPPPPRDSSDTPRRPAHTTTPRRYTVWAILALLFCCLPTGIVALIYDTKIPSRFEAGDIAGSRRAGNTALAWIIISVILGMAGYLFLLAGMIRSASAGNP